VIKIYEEENPGRVDDVKLSTAQFWRLFVTVDGPCCDDDMVRRDCWQEPAVQGRCRGAARFKLGCGQGHGLKVYENREDGCRFAFSNSDVGHQGCAN